MKESSFPAKTQRVCCARANPTPAVQLTQNELSKAQTHAFNEVLVEAKKTEFTTSMCN